MSKHSPESIKAEMERYGISEHEAGIALDRRPVYGDPFDNHQGIAMAWAGLLQPWALDIAQMKAIPPHVVAMMMAALKANRTRLMFHKDNYDDSNVYMAFARTWQEEHEARGGAKGAILPEKPKDGKQYDLKMVWQEPQSSLFHVTNTGGVPSEIEYRIGVDTAVQSGGSTIYATYLNKELISYVQEGEDLTAHPMVHRNNSSERFNVLWSKANDTVPATLSTRILNGNGKSVEKTYVLIPLEP